MEFRYGCKDDYINIRNFYYEVIDEMQDAKYSPAWEKDVYPTQEYLLKSIEDHELYIGVIDGKIASCCVVNHEYNEAYKNVSWSMDVSEDELFVIHILGVHPSFSGRGIAKQMVQAVFDMAKDRSIKTIRLDVLAGNIPAIKVYENMGFTFIESIKMFYEDTGWTDFDIFEYNI